MGLLRPDSGRIFVGDEEITAMKDRKLRNVRNRFGVVFQHAALFDSMNVFDNVAFPLVEHTRMRRKEVAERVDGLLAEVGLAGMGYKQVSELSGGMRKRVGLARALVRDPEFLFYDEPTTGLDPVLAAAMDKLILDTQVANPQLTSVIISHDMSAVFRIGHKGRVPGGWSRAARGRSGLLPDVPGPVGPAVRNGVARRPHDRVRTRWRVASAQSSRSACSPSWRSVCSCSATSSPSTG